MIKVVKTGKLTKPCFGLLLLSMLLSLDMHAQGTETLNKRVDSNITYRQVGQMRLGGGGPNPDATTGEGISVVNTHVTLAAPAKQWKGSWYGGQFPLPSNGKIVLRAEVKGATPLFGLQVFRGGMLPQADVVTSEDNRYEAVWFLKDVEPKMLAHLHLTLNREATEASAKISELSIWTTSAPNALDADTILQTPPVHHAELREHNGAMTMFLDGQPISGQMWTAHIIHELTDWNLEKILPEQTGLDYPIAAINFAVGENRLHDYYPYTWLGPDEYDWSYIDTQARRVLKINPNRKIILNLALDGALWWTQANPEANHDELDARRAKSNLPPIGTPDYLSPLWKQDVRELLRQLVAHVQSSDWGSAVIGYELFNGHSMDCNFTIPRNNARAVRDFRSLLKTKYATDADLQRAWRDPEVTRDSALPWSDPFPAEFIIEPAMYQHYLDTKAFIADQYRSVFSHVAAIIKEATHDRALFGARTGNLFGNDEWNNHWHVMEDSGWVLPLLRDPNFDYFDVQEPYQGRQLGTGTGVPVLPPHALQQFGKAVFIQNDVRTHFSPSHYAPGYYGKTTNMADTIQIQRRVFVNSLTYNMFPYLYQLQCSYADDELVAEYRRQEMIRREASLRDRSSVAEVAMVFDPRMRLYFGKDTKRNTPTGRSALLEWTKNGWQRAGVPFDMIFLDQIEDLPPYRVYVFCNTFAFTPEQVHMIQRKVLTNGRTAVFLWADGIISDDGTFSTATLNALTGMDIQMSREPETWQMLAAEGVPGLVAGTEIGTHLGPEAAAWDFEPSFQIQPADGVVALAHRADGTIGAALRRAADHTVIYSASANLTVPLFKLALESAGAFQYTDSNALLMMNRSYLALHADKDETIALRLPSKEALKDLFSGKLYPKAKQHDIPVEKNHTYLFERITN